MKRNIIMAVTVATLGVATLTANASWFGDSEKERRIETQQQLEAQQEETGNWQGIAVLLGMGCVVALLAGTMAGSRARSHANQSTR